MLFYVFLGIMFLHVFLSIVFRKRVLKSQRLERVVEIAKSCSLYIGVGGLILTMIIMFALIIEPYDSDNVYDVRTKVTTAELYSVKYSDGYYNCIQGTSNGEYIQKLYSARDTKITMKKDISPHIEIMEHTGELGPIWLIPFAQEKQGTEYHLYIPVNHPDTFQIN